jgi:hypothetical protein
MINESLKKYFEDNINKGYTYEQLAQACREQGYAEADLFEIKNSLNKKTNNSYNGNGNTKKKSSFTGLFIVIILLLIIGGVTFYFQDSIMNFFDDDSESVGNNDTFDSEIVEKNDLTEELNLSSTTQAKSNYYSIAENGSLIINEDDALWALGEYQPISYEYEGQGGAQGIIVEYEDSEYNSVTVSYVILGDDMSLEQLIDKSETKTLSVNGNNFLLTDFILIWETNQHFDIIGVDLYQIFNNYEMDLLTELIYNQLINELSGNSAFKSLNEKFSPAIKDYSEFDLDSIEASLSGGSEYINMDNDFYGVPDESYALKKDDANSYVFLTLKNGKSKSEMGRTLELDTDLSFNKLVTEEGECDLVWTKNIDSNKTTYDEGYSIEILTNNKYKSNEDVLQLDNLFINYGETFQVIFDCNFSINENNLSNQDILQGEFDIEFTEIENDYLVRTGGIVILNII